MSDHREENRVSLDDNSHEMAEAQGTTESATQVMKRGAQAESGGASCPRFNSVPGAGRYASDPWYTKPESFGGTAGDKIQSFLSPVGNTAGKGLEMASKPAGGIVELVIGGLMKRGKAFGE